MRSRAVPTCSIDPKTGVSESQPVFVRCKKRFTDGKKHRFRSVVENCRASNGRVVLRQILHPARPTTASARPGAA